MNIGRVSLFLISASAFAATHVLAIELSLYWYYWWFDLMMHFWGGLLLGFGLHAVLPFSLVPLRPSTGLVLVILCTAIITWEVFEWLTGSVDSAAYVFDTSTDSIVGFAGGLLAHLFLRKRYNRAT